MVISDLHSTQYLLDEYGHYVVPFKFHLPLVKAASTGDVVGTAAALAHGTCPPGAAACQGDPWLRSRLKGECQFVKN